MGCSNCVALKTQILEQVEAFEVLASLNPGLGWQVLVGNIKAVASRYPTAASGVDPTNREVSPIEASESELANNGQGGSIIGGTTPVHFNDEGEMLMLLPVGEKDDTRHHKITQSSSLTLVPMPEEPGPSVEPRVPQKRRVDNTLTLAKLKLANEWIEKSGRGPTKVYKCLKCQKNLRRCESAQLHVRRIHFGDRFTCPNCHKKFYSVTHLKNHTFKCPSSPPSPPQRPHKIDNHHRKLESDRLVVRNPCKNFNLKKTLTAQVKLKRMMTNQVKKTSVTLLPTPTPPQPLVADFVTYRPHLQSQNEDGPSVQELSDLVDFGPYEVVDVHGEMRKIVRLQLDTCPPPTANGGAGGRRVSSRLLDRKVDDLVNPVVLMTLSDDEGDFTHGGRPIIKMEREFENFDQYEDRPIFKQEPGPPPPMVCLDDEQQQQEQEDPCDQQPETSQFFGMDLGGNFNSNLFPPCLDNRQETMVYLEPVHNIEPSDLMTQGVMESLTLHQENGVTLNQLTKGGS